MSNTSANRVQAVAYGLTGGALTAAALGFAFVAGVGWADFVGSYTLTNVVIGLGFLLPGVVIHWHHARNRIAALLLVSGFGALSTAAAGMMLWHGLAQDWPGAILRTLMTVYVGAWQLGIGLCFSVALLLFPTGRLPSPRWRPVLWLVIAEGVYQLGSGILSGGGFNDDPRAVSIVSVNLPVEGTLVNTVMGLLLPPLTLAPLVSLVVRYRRGDEKIKRQVLWLLFAMVCILLINSQRWITGDGPILLLLSSVLVPIAIGVAIVRYELFDIRLVLSRTMLYTATVGAIVAIYAGLVTALSAVISGQLERGVPTGAALVAAIVFNPLRIRLQRLIDRAFYGGRSDPAATARHVGEQLQRADELADVLERARQVLLLPWMALHRMPGGERLAEAGRPGDNVEAAVDLSYRGEPVGALRIQLRRGETALHEADRSTLELICTPLAIALHATALSEQVRQARTATVEAAVAERVRLQRELHDELGPTLTSIAFRADAAANIMHTDAEQAHDLIGEVRSELRAVVDDVRRIVYGLRPIELEDFGLAGALRHYVDNIPARSGRQLRVALSIPERLPALSPAVELAAYRIAVEAVTNARLHSNGDHCLVSLAVDRDLQVTVTDNGNPDGTWRPGIGLRSIHDRAEELSGTATAQPTDQGWTVHARLPFHAPN